MLLSFHTKTGFQSLMDRFAAADEAVSLVTSSKRTVVMHQLTCIDTRQANIIVNGTIGLKSRPLLLPMFIMSSDCSFEKKI